MSGGISISFVDFAVVSFAFDRILLRFVQVVSGAKLVRFIWRSITRGFVLKNSASGSTDNPWFIEVRLGPKSRRQVRMMRVHFECEAGVRFGGTSNATHGPAGRYRGRQSQTRVASPVG
jgi:hypothetical protein